MREKLAYFYAPHTLTKTLVILAAPAESTYLLSNRKFRKTTG
jgi:hypothetical protein